MRQAWKKEVNVSMIPILRLLKYFPVSLSLSGNASSTTSPDWRDLASISKLIGVIGAEVSVAPNVELMGKKCERLKEETVYPEQHGQWEKPFNQYRSKILWYLTVLLIIPSTRNANIVGLKIYKKY